MKKKILILALFLFILTVTSVSAQVYTQEEIENNYAFTTYPDFSDFCDEQVYSTYSPRGGSYWRNLDPAATNHEEILAYKIHWVGSGKWSEWYYPGENDLDEKTTFGAARSKWSYFEDHDHIVVTCKDPNVLRKDKTPRIMYWSGKVNQHTDENGNWQTDEDGISGTYLDKLAYCKKFWPATSSIEEYKKESIDTWKDHGNINAYTSIRQSYKCVQADHNDNNDNTNKFFLLKDEYVIFNGQQVTLKSVGQNSVLVDVDGQTKAINRDQKITFDQADNFQVKLNDFFYIEGAADNSAELALYSTNNNNNNNSNRTAPNLPDLTITHVEQGHTITDGLSSFQVPALTFEVEITNQGDAPASLQSGGLFMKVNNHNFGWEELKTATKATLDAGESTTVTIVYYDQVNFNALTSQRNDFRFYVDTTFSDWVNYPNGNIVESDETNNEFLLRTSIDACTDTETGDSGDVMGSITLHDESISDVYDAAKGYVKEYWCESDYVVGYGYRSTTIDYNNTPPYNGSDNNSTQFECEEDSDCDFNQYCSYNNECVEESNGQTTLSKATIQSIVMNKQKAHIIIDMSEVEKDITTVFFSTNSFDFMNEQGVFAKIEKGSSKLQKCTFPVTGKSSSVMVNLFDLSEEDFAESGIDSEFAQIVCKNEASDNNSDSTDDNSGKKNAKTFWTKLFNLE